MHWVLILGVQFGIPNFPHKSNFKTSTLYLILGGGNTSFCRYFKLKLSGGLNKNIKKIERPIAIKARYAFLSAL